MALHQRTVAAAELDAVKRRFGTANIADIIASILRGLRRAEALEARLEASASRLDAPPRQPRNTTPTPRAPRPEALAEAAPLTPEQRIVAEARRRPIGAVLADICRDFGISPQHPLWRELQRTIIFEGGNFARFTSDMFARSSKYFLSRVADPYARLIPLAPTPAGTGPP